MKPVYYLGWSAYRFLFATYFRWRVYHPERVPPHGPVILAANHASFLDPPLVGAGLSREINYLARESLFRYPGIGWLLRAINSVPVDRDGGGGAGLKAILDRLLKGVSGRNSHSRRPTAARAVRRWTHRHQIHRAGGAGAGERHLPSLRPPRSFSASSPRDRDLRPTDAFREIARGSQDRFPTASEGNLPGSGR